MLFGAQLPDQGDYVLVADEPVMVKLLQLEVASVKTACQAADVVLLLDNSYSDASPSEIIGECQSCETSSDD
jgi:hypothetical protein